MSRFTQTIALSSLSIYRPGEGLAETCLHATSFSKLVIGLLRRTGYDMLFWVKHNQYQNYPATSK